MQPLHTAAKIDHECSCADHGMELVLDASTP